MPWKPQLGAVVDVLAGNNPPKVRPGVVIEVDEELILVCLVAYGTGTSPEQRRRQGDSSSPHVAVFKASAEGGSLALDKDTWFYPGERKSYEATEVQPRPGALPCPPLLLARLRRLHRP